MAVRKLILLAALCFGIAASAQPLPDCVHAEASVLLFPGARTAQDLFYAKLDTLVATGQGNVNV